MDGERWCTSTKELQETLLQVCNAVRRMPRNSGAATLQFVWNVEHTAHNTLHTAHYKLHTFFEVRTLARASMLVYVLNYSTNMPTLEETCYGGWHVDFRCAEEAEGRRGVADDIIIRVFLTNTVVYVKLVMSAVGSPGWMVDTPLCRLRDASCMPIFFVKDLGLELLIAPKMCPDQSQAIKEVNNSQTFTVSRCPKACLHKVYRKYSKNWLRETNIKSYLTPKIDSTLKSSNYDAKPWFLHFIAQKSKCSRRFWEIDPEFCKTCSNVPLPSHLRMCFFFSLEMWEPLRANYPKKCKTQISGQKINK